MRGPLLAQNVQGQRASHLNHVRHLSRNSLGTPFRRRYLDLLVGARGYGVTSNSPLIAGTVLGLTSYSIR